MLSDEEKLKLEKRTITLEAIGNSLLFHLVLFIIGYLDDKMYYWVMFMQGTLFFLAFKAYYSQTVDTSVLLYLLALLAFTTAAFVELILMWVTDIGPLTIDWKCADEPCPAKNKDKTQVLTLIGLTIW